MWGKSKLENSLQDLSTVFLMSLPSKQPSLLGVVQDESRADTNVKVYPPIRKPWITEHSLDIPFISSIWKRVRLSQCDDISSPWWCSFLLVSFPPFDDPRHLNLVILFWPSHIPLILSSPSMGPPCLNPGFKSSLFHHQGISNFPIKMTTLCNLSIQYRSPGPKALSNRSRRALQLISPVELVSRTILHKVCLWQIAHNTTRTQLEFSQDQLIESHICMNLQLPWPESIRSLGHLVIPKVLSCMCSCELTLSERYISNQWIYWSSWGDWWVYRYISTLMSSIVLYLRQ